MATSNEKRHYKAIKVNSRFQDLFWVSL